MPGQAGPSESVPPPIPAPHGPRPTPDAPRSPSRWGEGLPPDLIYPWDPPGKRPAGAPQPGHPAPGGPRRRRRIGRIVLATLAILALAFVVRLGLFFGTISTEPLWSAHFRPFGAAPQANVLILGYGGGNHEGGYLTDSIALLHTDLASRRSAQISLPRDLWVQIPPDSGRYAKLNSAYAYGAGDGGRDPAGGGRLATTKAGQVTGLTVDRWVTIDFRGFRALVDALGGVEIEVERSFTSRYPANDDPSIDPSWTTVTFAAGRQRMDGERAIRYARARYAEEPEEASDFARAQRQQKLVRAIGMRLTSPAHWWRAPAVLDALEPTLRTNLAPVDLLVLLLRADLGGAARIALEESGILEDARSDDGQDILRPRGGDYDALGRYVQERLADGGR